MPKLRTKLLVLQEQADAYSIRYGFPMADWDAPCAGCASSAASAPYPGHPSGEHACLICSRNPDQAGRVRILNDRVRRFQTDQRFLQVFLPYVDKPIDNYKTVDVLANFRQDLRKASNKFEELMNVIREAVKNDPDNLRTKSDP